MEGDSSSVPPSVPPPLRKPGVNGLRPKPREGKQNASLTDSMKRAGSQKLTGIPMRKNMGGGKGHMHTGEEARSGTGLISSMGLFAIVTPAILNGNMQCQQTSVRGLCGVPAQTARAGVGNKTTTIATRRARSCLLYTSPSPRDLSTSRMPSSA